MNTYHHKELLSYITDAFTVSPHEPVEIRQF